MQEDKNMAGKHSGHGWEYAYLNIPDVLGVFCNCAITAKNAHHGGARLQVWNVQVSGFYVRNEGVSAGTNHAKMH